MPWQLSTKIIAFNPMQNNPIDPTLHGPIHPVLSSIR